MSLFYCLENQMTIFFELKQCGHIYYFEYFYKTKNGRLLLYNPQCANFDFDMRKWLGLD